MSDHAPEPRIREPGSKPKYELASKSGISNILQAICLFNKAWLWERTHISIICLLTSIMYGLCLHISVLVGSKKGAMWPGHPRESFFKSRLPRLSKIRPRLAAKWLAVMGLRWVWVASKWMVCPKARNIYIYTHTCKCISKPICIYVYMLICIYVFMYAWMYVYMYTHMNMYVYIYVCRYKYICICVYMYIFVWVCISVYVYVCMCMYVMYVMYVMYAMHVMYVCMMCMCMYVMYAIYVCM